MSDGTIVGDVVARLIKVTPKELDKLVKDGVVPREGPNKFILAKVIHAYIDHLVGQLAQKDQNKDKFSQAELAEHLDISERRLRDLLREFGLDHKADSADSIRLAYISKLREEAAGRSEKGLAAVRERETMASAQLKELDLAERLKLIINIPDIEPLLIHLMKDMQAQIIAAGNRAVQAIEAEHGITLNDELILKPIRSALGNVAGSADQFNSRLTGKPRASIAAATDGDSGVDREERKTAVGE
ncbi:protein phosphatase CheZ [Porticoccaceae bacterium]|nr:protein phosphatase CheZ [Porticoccaceae bacterium]